MKTYSKVEPYYVPVGVWKTDEIKGISEMTREQSGFLCGLIRDHKPEKILELGVASGGTTVNIIRCLEMIGLNSEMYSVDLSEKLYYDSEKETGYYAEDYLRQNACNVNHKFMLGRYLPEVLKEIGTGIDFVIMDTVHVLPGELLDFLAVFPFLKKNAIVVLHDVVLSHENPIDDRYCFATQILFSSVFADKYLNNGEIFPNIVALSINDHTKDSISNVFTALTLTWRYLMEKRETELYRNWYLSFYPKELISIFDQAVLLNNKTLQKPDKIVKEYFRSTWDSLLSSYNHILLYGNGKRGKSFYGYLSAMFDDDRVTDRLQFLVSSEKEAKERKCLWYEDISYNKYEVLIILTASSEELFEKLSKQMKWKWLCVPEYIWFEIERIMEI